MLNPFDRRARAAPARYPRLIFHGIRLAQLVSSLIVGGIMCYFIYHLTHDHWHTPWTFIWLSAASLASVAVLIFTIFLHCLTGLHPHFNLALNGVLVLLWALSWSLLTWYMSGLLKNACDAEHWKEDLGIMVCRTYKALFVFTLMGLLSTIAAISLDVYVFRSQTQRGIYRLHDMNGGEKRGAVRPDPTHGPFTETATYGEGGIHAHPRESDAWEQPRGSMAPYSEHHDDVGLSQDFAQSDKRYDYDTEYHGQGAGGA